MLITKAPASDLVKAIPNRYTGYQQCFILHLILQSLHTMNMRSSIFPLLLLFFFCGNAQTAIKYGDNPKAGKYCKVNGIRIYYETYGTGKPLLLLHGNGGSINAFEKTIPYFSKYYKVIAVDSRAHGKSTDPGDSLSFEMMADDFSVLLDSLKIDSADVIGWSDGGIDALLLAMRYPNKVRRLAATGANIRPDSTALMPEVYHQMQDEYIKNKDKVLTDPHQKNDWKILLLDVFQPNLADHQLSIIKCPSLIIAGDRDVIVPEHTIAIFRAIPHAFLWILPSSGHPTLIEHTDEFNKKVHAFFEGKQF